MTGSLRKSLRCRIRRSWTNCSPRATRKSEVDRLHDPDDCWDAGPEACQHVLCRGSEPYDAVVDAPVYPANERLFEEVGESRSDGRSILHLLQLRPGASDAPRHASHGGRHRVTSGASRKLSVCWSRGNERDAPFCAYALAMLAGSRE